jgi:hypothetical protein
MLSLPTSLPLYIPVIFGLTTVATGWMLYRVFRNASDPTVQSYAKAVLTGSFLWLTIQAFMAFSDLYSASTMAWPPRIILLGVAPMLLLIVVLFITASGRKVLDHLSLPDYTYLHTVRIPVEIVLFWLYVHQAVPELMTFEGRNFDILAGLTAPLVAYFGMAQKRLGNSALLIWNFLALGLLLNIVIHAVLSAPFPFQQLAFDQPNIAILYFPYVWLPTYIVPVVLLGHLMSIRRLLTRSPQDLPFYKSTHQTP